MIVQRKRVFDRTRAWVLGAAMLGLLLASAGSGQAQTEWLTIAETENLVRAIHFEGLPKEDALRIGPDGAARLVEMLADPDEAERHGQIMMALGLSGSAQARAAIEAWLATPRAGEVDRATFRAWQAAPHALGEAARFDARALDRLDALIRAGAPNWSFRQHRGDRLRRLRRDAALDAMAKTGLPRARVLLERVGRELPEAQEPEFAARLRAARAIQAERAREAGR